MVDSKQAHNDDEEMIFDPDSDTEEFDTESMALDKIKALRQKLTTCQKERQEYLDGWQRQKADHLNAKRRMEDERAQDADRQAAKFVEKLLPLCDSFDIALKNLPEKGSTGSEWRSGIEGMYAQLSSILSSYGVRTLTPTGEQFDPHMHEAVSEAPVTTDTQHHTVIDTLQSGYAVNDRLIRPAKVVVGNYTAPKK